jgi:hypothetical protein
MFNRPHPSVSLLSGVCLALLAAGLPPSAAAPKKPALSSGRITYRFTTPVASGTSVLCWAEGGKKFRQEMKGSGAGDRQITSVESWTFGDGKHIYIHQPAMGRQVMRAKAPQNAGAAGSATPLLTTDKNAGKAIGSGKVLGKTCQIRQMGPNKIWVWNGLALKMESKGGPQSPPMSMVATKLETGIKLSPTLFKLPAGFQIRDIQLPPASAGK